MLRLLIVFLAASLALADCPQTVPGVAGQVVANCPTLTHDAQCTVTCGPNFTATGNGVYTCANTDAWTGGDLVCTAITKCVAGPSVANSNNACANTDVNTSCTMACAANHNPTGTAVYACGADGQWTAGSLTCAAVTCAAEGPAVANKVVAACANTAVGEKCTVACMANFNAAGAAEYTCGANGSWGVGALTCTAITNCPQAGPTVTNQVVANCANTAVGQKCTVACLANHNAAGAAEYTCGADGQWQVGDLTCTAITHCTTAPAVANSDATSCANTEVGQSCTLACAANHNPTGTAAYTCGADGQYTGGSLTCTAVTCAAEGPAVANKVVATCANTAVTEKCTVACMANFNAAGAAEYTCGANGSWTVGDLTCTAITKCVAGPSVANSNNACGDTDVNSSCTMACAANHNPTGTAAYACGADGQWTGGSLTCTAVTCPAVGPTVANKVAADCANLAVGNTCTVACMANHIAAGVADYTCGSDGQWQVGALTCTAITKCVAGPTVANSNNACGDTDVDTSCTMACAANQIASGTAEYACGADGQWTGGSLVCTAPTCPAVGPTVANKVVADCANLAVGNTCTVACMENYTAAGAAEYTCDATGAWGTGALTCTEATTSSASTISMIFLALLSIALW